MPCAAIASDTDETLQVEADLAAQVALENKTSLLDHTDNLTKLFVAQFLRADVRVNARLFQNDKRVRRPDAVDVTQRDANLVGAGNINTLKSGHNVASN